MSKPENKPRIIVLGGERYHATVFKIQTRYENGIPEDCTLLHDNITVEVVGGEAFLIAYVSERMLRPRDDIQGGSGQN